MRVAIDIQIATGTVIAVEVKKNSRLRGNDGNERVSAFAGTTGQKLRGVSLAPRERRRLCRRRFLYTKKGAARGRRLVLLLEQNYSNAMTSSA